MAAIFQVKVQTGHFRMPDIHGCYEKYRTMLEPIEFAEEDTLCVLGGVPDRGPDGEYDLEKFLFCRPDPDTAHFPDKVLAFGHTPTRLLYKQRNSQ